MLTIPGIKNQGAKPHSAAASIAAARCAVLLGLLAGGWVVTTPLSVLATQSVTLAWDPVTNASVAGYNIYYGSVSGNYTNVASVGNVTNATISGLTEGTTYYFATTTLSTAGLESSYSSKISYTVPSIIPPLPSVITKTITAGITNAITFQFATNLASPNWQTIGTFAGSTTLSFTNLPAVFIRGVCNNLTGSATLTWPPSSDPILLGYIIYYGTVSQSYNNTVTVGKITTATISNLTAGKTYYFEVMSFNAKGLLSLALNQISAVPQAPGFSLTFTGP